MNRFSLRNLSNEIPVAIIREQIELEAGIVFNLDESLYLGDIRIDNREDLRFGKNINSGSVLTLRHLEQDSEPYERHDDDFIQLFLICHNGSLDDVTESLRLDNRRAMLTYCTPITKRTLLHAAAANNQDTVLNYILKQASQENIDIIWRTDRYDKTAVDVAKQRQCPVSERVITYASLRRTNPFHCKQKKKIKSAGIKTAVVSRTRPLRASTAIPRLRAAPIGEYDEDQMDVGDFTEIFDITPMNTERTVGSVNVPSKVPISSWSENNNRKWPPEMRSSTSQAISTPSRDKVYITAKNARDLVSSGTSFVRQKSAYYRGRCHEEYDAERDCIGERIDKRLISQTYWSNILVNKTTLFRPESANSRYRSWKTWLKSPEHEKIESEQKVCEKKHKKEENDFAFIAWCKIKNRQKNNAFHEEIDSTKLINQKRLNTQAYKNWIRKKTPIFSRKIDEPFMNCREIRYDPRLGEERQLPDKPNDTHKYINAYKLWQEKDIRHAYSMPYEDPVLMTRDQVETIRHSLVHEGMTYGEWCAQKRREYELGDSKVYLPSPRRAKDPIKETACFSIVAE